MITIRNTYVLLLLFFIGVVLPFTVIPVANGHGFAAVVNEQGYSACCQTDSCQDAPVGCDPGQCISIEPGEICTSNELVANCESDTKGTICEPLITKRLGLTRVVPPGPVKVPGCCLTCPAGGGNCDSCVSVNDHSICGGLIRANCKLLLGDWSCEEAKVVPPCGTPPCGIGIPFTKHSIRR